MAGGGGVRRARWTADSRGVRRRRPPGEGSAGPGTPAPAAAGGGPAAGGGAGSGRSRAGPGPAPEPSRSGRRGPGARGSCGARGWDRPGRARGRRGRRQRRRSRAGKRLPLRPLSSRTEGGLEKGGNRLPRARSDPSAPFPTAPPSQKPRHLPNSGVSQLGGCLPRGRCHVHAQGSPGPRVAGEGRARLGSRFGGV